MTIWLPTESSAATAATFVAAAALGAAQRAAPVCRRVCVASQGEELCNHTATS